MLTNRAGRFVYTSRNRLNYPNMKVTNLEVEWIYFEVSEISLKDLKELLIYRKIVQYYETEERYVLGLRINYFVVSNGIHGNYGTSV
jgi:hypothetical protein